MVFFLVTCTKIFLFICRANVFQQLQGFCEKYRLYFHNYVSSLKNSLIDLLLKSHIASGDLPVSMMQVGHQILLEQQQKRRKLVDFDLKPFIHLQKAWNIANIETYGLFCAAFWAFWTWQPMINKEKKISVCISQKKRILLTFYLRYIYIYIKLLYTFLAELFC